MKFNEVPVIDWIYDTSSNNTLSTEPFRRKSFLSKCHFVECPHCRNMFRRILSKKSFMLTICCHNVSADHVHADIYANSVQIFQNRTFFIVLILFILAIYTYFRDWLIGACPATNCSVQVRFYKILGSNIHPF